MSKELLISRTLNEWRAVLMDNGEIIDFLMDRLDASEVEKPRVGNIYKGKVLRVLPGMQSAFIDIGWQKAAFLYVDDAYLPSLDEQREVAEKFKDAKKKQKEKEKIGEVIPDELSTLSETMEMRFRSTKAIESFLKEGQEIVVQIAKEPISTKGPRVTRHITLPGRHVVYMPYIEHTGVSRRIESEGERERLREILDSIRNEGVGVIARTAAESQSLKTLKSDYGILVKLWKELERGFKKAKAPKLCYQDLPFVHRVLRDITDENVDQIIIDDQESLQSVEKFASKYLPNLKGKTRLYNGEIPLFEKSGVDLELERGISNKVFLRSGGSLNIDQTEALVSVDVNTGKFVGRKNLEDTILKTNLEAVKEIAYQLRLRNCGGIIIIDFIDMEKEDHRDAVYSALLDALKKDRSKTNVLPISGLGLVEMTRKRTRDTLTRLLCSPCPYCEGTGRVKSISTICYELIRELFKSLDRHEGKKVLIFAHPEVTARLCGEDLEMVQSIENRFSKSLIIRSENNYHIEQYEIIPQ
jgi:ribonuclease G